MEERIQFFKLLKVKIFKVNTKQNKQNKKHCISSFFIDIFIPLLP